jgi:hypothetical protein
VEAVEFCRRVDEIDTTGKTAPQVAELVARIIKDELELPPGQVDWLIDFFGWKID